MQQRCLLLSILLALLHSSVSAEELARPAELSEGVYRLPYADGTTIKVFDDFTSHRPRGRIDFFAIAGERPYRVVAAASGHVVAIEDRHAEKQSGRAAADCRNNYVWIAHANGEWTNYSHLSQGSVTNIAQLKVGDFVEAGTLIGIEGTVGCSMLDHVHFEVAMPAKEEPIDRNGFLRDNDAGKRERNPRFCNVATEIVKKDMEYRAQACSETSATQ